MRHRCLPQPALSADAGFTMIEMMMVVAVIAILAMIALPSFQGRIIRSQVFEAIKLVDFVKQGVAAYYVVTHDFPADNIAAEVPPADRIVSKLVSKVEVRDGAITLTFGNDANGALRGKQLTLRPAYVEGFPQVPLSWVCGHGLLPEKMKAAGLDDTTLEANHLPIGCRAVTAAK